jgi:hypothetical protein
MRFTRCHRSGEISSGMWTLFFWDSGGGQFAAQPGARHRPFTLDGRWRQAGRIGSFFDRQSAEVPQLDDATLFGIYFLKAAQCGVDRKDVWPTVIVCGIESVQRARLIDLERRQRIIETDLHVAIAALCGISLSRIVHEDATHHLRCEREELTVTVPGDFTLIRQAYESLVDQGGSLQRVILTLGPQALLRQVAKLGIHAWHQFVQRFSVAVSPLLQ